MRKIILSLIAITILTGIIYPQKMRDKILKNKNKLEQLEKVKLIEALDLSEESSIRFFARRGDFKKEMEKLEARNDEVILELENTFNSDDKNIENKQSLLLNEFLTNKQDVEIKRQEFLSSLNDILSKEQVCKYVVFEKKFRDEIRSIIMDNKRHKKN